MRQPTPSGSDSRVIDFTPLSTAEKTAPEANDPRKCKFILVTYQGSNVLVFGDIASFRYHADLLRHFCRQRGIETSWVHKPDLLESIDPALTILGGGFLELNSTARSATFSGASKAYGPCPWPLLESILVTNSMFATMTIRVES